MTDSFWSEENKNKEESVNSKERLVRGLLMALGALSLVGLGAVGVIWGVKANPELFGLDGSSIEQEQRDLERYLNEVGEMMLLPNEVPTLATVADMDGTRGQSFFDNAQLGDIVLIFSDARKAILYRPTEKKIIEVGIVNIEEEPTLENEEAGSEDELIKEQTTD